MKKHLFLLAFISFSLSCFAQKEYIELNQQGGYIYLAGNVPSDLRGTYDNSALGTVFTKLADKGFEMEFAVASSYSDNYFIYIFSKKVSSPSSSIATVNGDNSADVVEVARYNLQGLPVGRNEKGVQVIVYSNYTTKTVIVQ